MTIAYVDFQFIPTNAVSLSHRIHYVVTSYITYISYDNETWGFNLNGLKVIKSGRVRYMGGAQMQKSGMSTAQ